MQHGNGFLCWSMNRMIDVYNSLQLKQVKAQMLPYCHLELSKTIIDKTKCQFDYLFLKHALNCVKEAMHYLQIKDAPSFIKVSDMGDVYEEANKNRILTTRNLYAVGSNLEAIKHLQKSLHINDDAIASLQELSQSLQFIQPLHKMISHCINDNFEIFDHASEALQIVREQIKKHQEFIQITTSKFLTDHADKLNEQVISIRNDRLCVLAKISQKHVFKGIIYDESASKESAYVEPKAFFELNNRRLSLQYTQQQEELKILRQLSKEVAKHSHILQANQDTFAQLDCIFAKALWAFNKNGCVADIKKKSDRLLIREARHPLIDEKKVIANTYEINKPYRCILMSGVNTGGKTVTLKTIGLCVVMSLCGMPILAEEAIIPLFDGVYVDIGDQQNVLESLSTFSSHISKIARMIQKATSHSLILLDELASGTDPNEGEALGIAILDELQTINAMVVATSHYDKIKQYALHSPHIIGSAVAFDIERLVPTYKYMEGMQEEAYAFVIAKRYGISPNIIEKAEKWKLSQMDEQAGILQELQNSLKEAQLQKQQIENKLTEIKLFQEKTQKEAKQVELKIAQAQEEANIRIDRDIQNKIMEAEQIIKQLKTTGYQQKPHEIAKMQHTLHSLQTTQETKISNETFSVKDRVCLEAYQYYGEIIAIKKQVATILVNDRRLKVNLDQLTHTNKVAPQSIPRSIKKNFAMKAFSTEMNVIGEHVSEALALIDKFIDDAILMKANQIRIIHGVGTGALRKNIHAYLKKNKNVETFNNAGEYEGGLGATNVLLK